jgi:hypothetical protein
MMLGLKCKERIANQHLKTVYGQTVHQMLRISKNVRLYTVTLQFILLNIKKKTIIYFLLILELVQEIFCAKKYSLGQAMKWLCGAYYRAYSSNLYNGALTKIYIHCFPYRWEFLRFFPIIILAMSSFNITFLFHKKSFSFALESNVEPTVFILCDQILLTI